MLSTFCLLLVLLYLVYLYIFSIHSGILELWLHYFGILIFLVL